MTKPFMIRDTDFDLLVYKRGGSYRIVFTPHPDIPPERIRAFARGALFAALDAIDMVIPPDLTIEWGKSGDGEN